MLLDHERMDVYQCAVDFLRMAVELTADVPPGHGELRDQLRRASASIPLNIAEATGKPTPRDRARFYAVARGFAFECGALLDVLALLGAATPDAVSNGKLLLARIVSMLTRLCR